MQLTVLSTVGSANGWRIAATGSGDGEVIRQTPGFSRGVFTSGLDCVSAQHQIVEIDSSRRSWDDEGVKIDAKLK